MTFQVAICAKDGSIALVGDTKVRTSESCGSVDREVADAFENRSKIAYSERHGVAIAMAGHGRVGTDAAKDLAEYLSSLEADSLSDLTGLSSWGNRHFAKERDDAAKHGVYVYPSCSLIVASPSSKSPLWRLRVDKDSSSCTPSDSVMVNGHEANAAIFWLEYLKAQHCDTLAEAVGIAITAVLTAGELDPYGIDGLEVNQYLTGSWSAWNARECRQARAQFSKIAEQIKSLAFSLGHRPVTPLQP